MGERQSSPVQAHGHIVIRVHGVVIGLIPRPSQAFCQLHYGDKSWVGAWDMRLCSDCMHFYQWLCQLCL